MKLFAISSCLIVYWVLVSAAPVDDNSENNKNDDKSTDNPPQPYHYKYTVKDEEKQLFIDKTEAGDEKGKVTGKYSVLQPDGR